MVIWNGAVPAGAASLPYVGSCCLTRRLKTCAYDAGTITHTTDPNQ